MFRPLTSAAVLLLLAACRAPAPPARHPQAPPAAAVASPQETPDTTPPADVSHGEAPIGGPKAEPAPRLARLEPVERGRVHRIRLEIKHAAVPIAAGVTYAAWTFGGTVPGPALHVRQGDTVDAALSLRGARAGCLHVPLRHGAGGHAHRERDVRRAGRGSDHAAAQGR